MLCAKVDQPKELQTHCMIGTHTHTQKHYLCLCFSEHFRTLCDRTSDNLAGCVVGQPSCVVGAVVQKQLGERRARQMTCHHILITM